MKVNLRLRSIPSSGMLQAGAAGQAIQRAAALGMTLLMLLLGPEELLAQSGPYGNQYATPNGYGGQYGPPVQQYGQPQYGQPQYAPQPQYPQQQYPQPQGYPEQQYPEQSQGYPQQSAAQGLSAQQLEQLVAPIALYPDALLAQVLTAATYPAQVASADQWLHGARGASEDEIAAEVDAQANWDPSVKSLTAFPQVLELMDRNLEWTTNLGNAYYNQPQDVMQTVQVLRQRAEQAGNLESTPQEQVTNDQGYVELAPANPQVVYVPSYDPWDVYGQPVSPYPGFSLAGALGSFFGSALGAGFGGGAIRYGLGIGIGAFARFPWGFLGWGLSWLANSVLFNHSNYFSHSTTVADWGLPHGGPRAYSQRAGFAGGNGYRVGQSFGDRGYNRFGNGSNNGLTRGPGQAFANRPGEQGAYASRPDPREVPRSGGFNRGDPAPGYGSVRPAMPPQQAYNRVPQPVRPQTYQSRPQQYGQGYAGRPDAYARPGSTYGYISRPMENSFAPRGPAYAAPYAAPGQAYRPPVQGYQRGGDFGARSYGGPQMAYSGPRESGPKESGGFHMFGHGRESNGFVGGRAPKSFSEHAPKGWGAAKAPKGGGHSGGSKGSGHHR
jgi:hypothetical protein